MKSSERSSQARRELDRRFRQLNLDSVRIPPRSGWLKAIRGALGMSQADLARRLCVSGAAIAKLERAEADGRITLAKLNEVAKALDCTVVYALIPVSSLEDSVQSQAHRVASKQLGYVDGTMALEDQEVAPDRRAEYLDVYVRDLIARNDIWRQDLADRSRSSGD